MKAVIIAFFLLLAFSTTLPSTTADFVYGTDGEPLLNGGGSSYYIIGREGGLGLGKVGNETCPLSVVQAKFSPSLPARFSSRILLLHINEGMLISINFTKAPHCVPKPSHWKVVQEFPLGWAVKHTGGEFELETFKIERSENYGPFEYKLVYCPRDEDVCGDLGIHKRRLVVRDGNPFIVRFVKHIESSAKWNIAG